MDSRKYIFVNGVMKVNPNYNNPQVEKTSVADPKKALAVVSTPADMACASEVQQEKTGKDMQVADSTVASMEILQDPDFLSKFKTRNPIDGGKLLDGLTNFFAKYEVPIGMVNKMLALTEYKLNFLVDDSGSMGTESEMDVKDYHPKLKEKLPASGRLNKTTRWDEVENRLHIMIDMISFIPTEDIVINYLNRHEKIVLSHSGKTPEEFAADAHDKISKAFERWPSGGTPIYGKLKKAFEASTSNTMHYLFTDGEPSDATIEIVKQLVTDRTNPKMCPLTFMTCTDNDEEADWMKEVEEDAPYCAELDDFMTERKEVLNDQGPAFPFTKGMWLLAQLAAAINPDDLDALDESTPFTKMTMDNLLGRKLTGEEYKQYFDNNPNAKKWNSLYHEFAREDVVARQISAQHPDVGKKSATSLGGLFSRLKHGHHGSSSNSNQSLPHRP